MVEVAAKTPARLEIRVAGSPAAGSSSVIGGDRQQGKIHFSLTTTKLDMLGTGGHVPQRMRRSCFWAREVTFGESIVIVRSKKQ